MTKISLLPQQTTPTTADKAPIVSGGITDYVALSDLITLFFNNIPAGAHSDVTRGSETFLSFVASGGVWTGDSLGVNKNASMTAMVIYINGRRISINAVTARTFTASKDTYIDVLDNADGTGTLVYTEVANNAASPALASNSTRIGIIITGATFITNSGSVNQGQETMILPIASSIAYAVTDSLGNLICPRDPGRRILGYRQIVTTFSTSSSSAVQITGLSCPVIVPSNRKVKVTLFTPNANNTAGSSTVTMEIWDGAVAGTKIGGNDVLSNLSTNINTGGQALALTTPSAASKTYNGSLLSSAANNVTLNASSAKPAGILVELE